MDNFLSANRVKLEAIVLLIVIEAIIFLTVSPITPDMDKPQLVSLETGVKVYQQKANLAFVGLVIAGALVPIIYLYYKGEQQTSPRRRGPVDIYNDIPFEEKIKLGIPETIDVHFIKDCSFFPIDETYSILSIPFNEKSGYAYLTLDSKEDWKSRGLTPLYSFSMSNMGKDRAKTLLGKKGEPLGKFVAQAERYGLSQDEVRARILQKMEEDRRKAEQGGLNEGN